MVVATQRKTISQLVLDNFRCRGDIIPALKIHPLMRFAYEYRQTVQDEAHRLFFPNYMTMLHRDTGIPAWRAVVVPDLSDSKCASSNPEGG